MMYKTTWDIAWQIMPDHSNDIYIYLIPKKEFLLLHGSAVDIWQGITDGLGKTEIIHRIAGRYSLSSEDEVSDDVTTTIENLINEGAIYEC